MPQSIPSDIKKIIIENSANQNFTNELEKNIKILKLISPTRI